jgi:DNA-binding transcriptional regulator PaaX
MEKSVIDRRYKKGEQALEILTLIAKAGFILSLAVLAPNAAGHILKMLGMAPNYRSSFRVKRTLNSLQKQGYVYIKSKNGRTNIKLTKKGIYRYFNNEINKMALPVSRKWDGVWTLVTFDIPETKKWNRNRFSRALSIVGMELLEKSIFIYPYDCKAEIEKIARLFEVSEYVRYIRAKSVENDIKFRRLYRIN